MAKKRAKVAKVVIAFCHSKSAISGAKQAFDLNLIEPIFVGPKKIPELARGLGKAMNEFKKAKSEIKDEIQKTSDEVDSK